MTASNHRTSEGDLNRLSLKSVDNSEQLAFRHGFRLAEGALLLVVDKYITELTDAKRLLGILPKNDEELLDRVRVLESIVRGKDQMLRDSKGMVDVSYLVVCDKNKLLKECEGYLKGLSTVGDEALDKLLLKF